MSSEKIVYFYYEFVTLARDLINNVNLVIENCKKKGIIVVYIKHEIENNLFNRILAGRFIKDTPGSKIDSRVNIVSSIIYSKNKGNAFSNLELDSFLEENHIEGIFIVWLRCFCLCVKNFN
ncbi:isochorismatase family protein [Clostridium argentinense CDC 2741]|uniref:Isochorismatase family protein n=1 Tax=Clostridium argentinense CDC 2741 TaxID=1418104 RepID=A0A0C1R2R2_9CLOT|nr:isochorismatase family protein [Clostridium argentinense]ARC86130.1 hypothetical protein RSJ17_17335 [Clostridium argentinense]KIE47817.1 isochorismatase family protein [Clostridium argentinense CDC 2741]